MPLSDKHHTNVNTCMKIDYRNLCDTLHRQNHEKREKIRQVENENKALRKFILSMASQIGIIVKKL